MMPQNGTAPQSRRRGTRHNICHIPDTGLVNGAVVHNGWAGADIRTSDRSTAGTLNDTNPKFLPNGYINHRCKSNSIKSVPPRTLGRYGSTISAVTDASAAGRDRSAQTPAGFSVNGAISLDTAATRCSADQMASQPSLPTKTRNQRPYVKHRPKKRERKDVCSMNAASPLMPPKEEENWENEILDVQVIDWEKFTFGIKPYGPQDVLSYSLRDLTLRQRDTVDLLLPANYSPAVHHPRPVEWSCCDIHTEQDQFADADEIVLKEAVATSVEQRSGNQFC